MPRPPRRATLVARQLCVLFLVVGCAHHGPVPATADAVCTAPASAADSSVDVGSLTTPPSRLRTSVMPRLNLAHPGRSARVELRFVVDTLGRVERCGARVTATTPPDAADGVLEQLYRMRFTPGVVNGRKVRTSIGMVIAADVEVERQP